MGKTLLRRLKISKSFEKPRIQYKTRIDNQKYFKTTKKKQSYYNCLLQLLNLIQWFELKHNRLPSREILSTTCERLDSVVARGGNGNAQGIKIPSKPPFTTLICLQMFW